MSTSRRNVVSVLCVRATGDSNTDVTPPRRVACRVAYRVACRIACGLGVRQLFTARTHSKANEDWGEERRQAFSKATAGSENDVSTRAQLFPFSSRFLPCRGPGISHLAK